MKTIELTAQIFTDFKDLPEYDEIVILWHQDVIGNIYPMLAKYKGGYTFYYFGSEEEIDSPFFGWSNCNIDKYKIDGK
jgi:hypothetical protein